MNIGTYLTPIAALWRCCQPDTCKRPATRDPSPAAREAIDTVLTSVVNAAGAGVPPTARAQKHHDRLLDDQLAVSARSLGRRRLADSLERLETEYDACRGALRARSNACIRDWMMGVETFELERISTLHSQIEAANSVVMCAKAARHELGGAQRRPLSC